MTSVPNVVSLMTGSESFADRSAKVQVFIIPMHDQSFEEQPIWKPRQVEGLEGLSCLTSSRFPIADNVRDELGTWTLSTFTVPDGLLLKLVVSRNLTYVNRRHSAAIFFRTDIGAPNIEVRYLLSGSQRANFSVGRLSGRLHQLTFEDAAPLLKNQVHPKFQRMFTASRVAEVIDGITVLQEGQRLPVTQIETIQTGEEPVTVLVRRRRRNIKL